jgi:hypothetical protein
MPLMQVVMRLARNKQHPNGDDSQGYVLIAPLNAEGQLDVDLWHAHKKACTVVRFHPDPDEKADGLLIRRGSTWFFHYDEDHEGPDEAGHRLGEHVFREGEYVTVRHQGEEALTYKVTEARPVRT